MDESQGILADQSNRRLDFDPTKIRNKDADGELSEVESEQEKEVVPLDALSQEELLTLQSIGTSYQICLTPFVDGSVHSSDHGH